MTVTQEKTGVQVRKRNGDTEAVDVDVDVDVEAVGRWATDDLAEIDPDRPGEAARDRPDRGSSSSAGVPDSSD